MATPAQKKLVQKRLADMHEAKNARLKRFKWAGFSGKTLWDWSDFLSKIIGALAIPISIIVLIVNVNQFNAQQLVSATQALDQQHQTTLDTYLDRMSDLLLIDHLATSKPGEEVRALAEARTYAAVRNLDGARKGTLVRFLLTAGLISGAREPNVTSESSVPTPIISMDNADLSGADFSSAELSGANLSGANLSGANFSNADLRAAILSGANLSGANFSNADLSAVKISPSPSPSLSPVPSVTCVSLKGLCVPQVGGSTNLSNVDLRGADLSEAINLNAAILSGAIYNTKTAREGTLILGPTQWPQGFDPLTAKAICDDC